MEIDNEKCHRFMYERQNNDEIFNHYRHKQVPIRYLKAGRFGLFLRFQKEIFNLYRQIQINSPSANRLFLYLIEVCLGYDEDPKSEMNFNVKKLLKECNITNRKSLYDAIKYLQKKNIIFLLEKTEGKVIALNSSILSWNVDEERKMKVYEKSKDRISTPLE